MPTGVDRVELAYLDHLLTCREPLFGVARTTLGYVLLDAAGAAAIAARIHDRVDWGAGDGLSRLVRNKPQIVRNAESDLRRLALDRCLPGRLPQMLARHLPVGVAYLNVGHSNLTERMLQSLRHAACGRIAVMIHDTIPLDFPQYQRPGTPERFAAMLRRVRAHSDLMLYNTADTKARAEARMRAWGPVPPGIVAHLGVPVPVPGNLPDSVDPTRPWFVALGTIEPRKGHDLLLDIWQDMQADSGTDVPQLLICGARGWNNQAVFDRLDQLPADGPVRELPGLDDARIAAVLAGSRGLLFASRAEGFGLPAVEAAALNIPVICQDLPALREVLGDIPIYARETDRYQWRNMIESLGKGDRHEKPAAEQVNFSPPTWADHFKAVLRFT